MGRLERLWISVVQPERHFTWSTFRLVTTTYSIKTAGGPSISASSMTRCVAEAHGKAALRCILRPESHRQRSQMSQTNSMLTL